MSGFRQAQEKMAQHIDAKKKYRKERCVLRL
jgi:hypothetical protein